MKTEEDCGLYILESSKVAEVYVKIFDFDYFRYWLTIQPEFQENSHGFFNICDRVKAIGLENAIDSYYDDQRQTGKLDEICYFGDCISTLEKYQNENRR